VKLFFCTEIHTTNITAIHCQWVGKPQSCPIFLGFYHFAGRGPRHSHRQHAQKYGKDCACHSGDILADRQTDTHADMLIAIVCSRSRGWSNKTVLNSCLITDWVDATLAVMSDSVIVWFLYLVTEATTAFYFLLKPVFNVFVLLWLQLQITANFAFSTTNWPRFYPVLAAKRLTALFIFYSCSDE